MTNDYLRMTGASSMPTVAGAGAMVMWFDDAGVEHRFDGMSGALLGSYEYVPPRAGEYIHDGWIYSHTVCGCGHHLDSHSANGCQSGDDDGDGYFDECYCAGFTAGRLRPARVAKVS